MFDLPYEEHVDELADTVVYDDSCKASGSMKQAKQLYNLAKLAFLYSENDLDVLQRKGYLTSEDIDNLYKSRAIIIKATNAQIDYMATPDEEEIEETDEMEEENTTEELDGGEPDEVEDEIEEDEDEVEVVEISDEEESKSPLTPVSRESIFNYSDDNEEKRGWFSSRK